MIVEVPKIGNLSFLLGHGTLGLRPLVLAGGYFFYVLMYVLMVDREKRFAKS